MTWQTIDVRPPPGLIICKVNGTYVECIVRDDGRNLVLMSEEPMDWGDVEGWVAVPRDFYGFDGDYVRHEKI